MVYNLASGYPPGALQCLSGGTTVPLGVNCSSGKPVPAHRRHGCHTAASLRTGGAAVCQVRADALDSRRWHRRSAQVVGIPVVEPSNRSSPKKRRNIPLHMRPGAGCHGLVFVAMSSGAGCRGPHCGESSNRCVPSILTPPAPGPRGARASPHHHTAAQHPSTQGPAERQCAHQSGTRRPFKARNSRAERNIKTFHDVAGISPNRARLVRTEWQVIATDSQKMPGVTRVQPQVAAESSVRCVTVGTTAVPTLPMDPKPGGTPHPTRTTPFRRRFLTPPSVTPGAPCV